MLAAALEYLERGFSIVPTAPNKRPLIPWKRWINSPPSVEQCKHWWDDENPPGIAIITGKVSNLLVFDIENCGKGVYDDELPETLEAKSQSGGRHLYFQWSDGPWRHGWTHNDIHVADLKGNGGYVLAPPTQGEKGTYAWVNQLPSVLPPAWMRKPVVAAPAPSVVPRHVGPLFGVYPSRSERLMAIARKVVMAGGAESEVMAACLADPAGSKLTERGTQWSVGEVNRLTSRARELLPKRPVRLAFVTQIGRRDTDKGERIELKLKTSDNKVLRAGVTKMDTERWKSFQRALPYPDIGKPVWIELDGPRVSRWLRGPKE